MSGELPAQKGKEQPPASIAVPVENLWPTVCTKCVNVSGRNEVLQREGKDNRRDILFVEQQVGRWSASQENRSSNLHDKCQRQRNPVS